MKILIYVSLSEMISVKYLDNFIFDIICTNVSYTWHIYSIEAKNLALIHFRPQFNKCVIYKRHICSIGITDKLSLELVGRSFQKPGIAKYG